MSASSSFFLFKNKLIFSLLSLNVQTDDYKCSITESFTLFSASVLPDTWIRPGLCKEQNEVEESWSDRIVGTISESTMGVLFL